MPGVNISFKSMGHLWIILGIILMLSGCINKQKKKMDLLYSLQKSSKLVSTEVILSKFVFARKENKLFFIPLGEAHFAANTYAYVKYGIDFSKLKSDDIHIIDNHIEITLPKFEIISFSYPSEEFDLIDEYTDNAFFTKITYEEVDQVFRHAETQLWETVKQLGINKKLKANTSNVLKGFLGSFGYKKVIIHFTDV